MKTLTIESISSFLLLASLYILLPLLIYWDANSLAFALWMTLAFMNLFGQPLLIGSCIHSYLTQKKTYPCWLTLLLIVNLLLYLLPILLICLFIFSDPIPFNYN